MPKNKRNPNKSVEPEPSVPKKETQNLKRRKPSPSPSEKSESPSPIKAATPKRRTAYMIFCAQMRPTVVKENSDLKPKDIISFLGKLWKELPEDKKEDYKEIQREEKAAYDRYQKTKEDAGESPSPRPAQKRKASDDKLIPAKKKPTRGKK